MIEEIFRLRSPDFAKLRAFGFFEEGEKWVYRTEIFDGQFLLSVRISKEGKIETLLLDKLTGEPYSLHLVEEAQGVFVGRVRMEFEAALSKIAQDCFRKKWFESEQAGSLIAYAKEFYGEEPEFLWEKFPDHAILRRKDNRKWYGGIFTAERKKVGLKGEGKIEILDVRAVPEEIPSLIDREKIFPGWHMNKKHWITLPLNGNSTLPELTERLAISREIAGNAGK